MGLTPNAWAILIGVALLVGISKTGVPGIGILSVVLTVLAVGQENTRQANGTLLILLLIGDIFAVAWYRRHADWKVLVRLLPPAAAGIVLAYALSKGLQHFGTDRTDFDRLLARAIGAIVLTLLAINLFWTRSGRGGGSTGRDSPAPADGSERRVPRHWAFAVAVGGLAGVATMLSNAAGPLIVIYLLAMRLDKHAFLGTSAWYFLMLNSFKVPFMAELGWINAQTVMVNLPMAPVVIVGAAAGVLIARHLPQKAFRSAVELLAAAGALKLAIG